MYPPYHTTVLRILADFPKQPNAEVFTIHEEMHDLWLALATASETTIAHSWYYCSQHKKDASTPGSSTLEWALKNWNTVATIAKHATTT